MEEKLKVIKPLKKLMKSTIARRGKSVIFDFESGAFNHSATLPAVENIIKPSSIREQMFIRQPMPPCEMKKPKRVFGFFRKLGFVSSLSFRFDGGTTPPIKKAETCVSAFQERSGGNLLS